MRIKIYNCIIAFALLAVLTASATSKRSDDDDSDQDDFSFGLSEEQLFGLSSIPEDDGNLPDLICSDNGLCKCYSGTKSNRIDCSNAKLKNGRPLDTAFLKLSTAKSGFIASEIDLSHNEIGLLRKNHIVPEQAKHLQVLDVSFNRISDVQPHALDSFEKLIKLKLTHNRLLDEEISDDWLTAKLGKTLHQLYLDYNYIRQLDNGIFNNLVNLNKLVLDGNVGLQITKKTFGSQLANLKTLSLDNCGIETLPEDVFKALPNLQQLSFAGNPITKILPAIKYIPKLSILSLSGTDLSEIPQYAFKENTELKNIYLRQMKYLYRVNSCAFCRLENLNSVDFTDSKQLYSIDENAFGGTSDKEVLPTEFTELYLSNCNMSSLSIDLLKWSTIRQLSLNGNPWKCDCSLNWLLSNRKLHKFGKGKEEPMCASPEELSKVSLRDAGLKTKCLNNEVPHKQQASDSSSIIFLIFGMCAVVFVVSTVMVRKYGGPRATIEHLRTIGSRAGTTTTPTSSLGYANLERPGAVVVGSNAFNDDDENRLEDDFNRPEFV